MAAEHIVGNVRGVVGREIVGWIVNQEQPNVPEEIVVEGQDGSRLLFAPHFYRDDVAKKFGLPLFANIGFAISLDQLPRAWTRLKLTSRFGQLINNGEVVLPHREVTTASNQESCYIFTHIPKTGGTSLRIRLSQEVPSSRRCLLYPDSNRSDVAQLNKIPLHQRQQFSLVMGHNIFGLHRYMGRKCRYFTFVREPVSRLMSLYWHHRRQNVESISVKGVAVPLEAAMNEALIDEFDNHQVRMLAGVSADAVPVGKVSDDELELALYNVREYFDFIGTLDVRDENAQVLFRNLRIPYKPIGRENANPIPERSRSDERSNLLDLMKLKANNQYDSMLYEYLSQHPLFDGVRNNDFS